MLSVTRRVLSSPSRVASVAVRHATSIVAGGEVHSANAPSHVAGSHIPFSELTENPMAHTTHLGRDRAINLAAGAAALPLEVLERAAKDFVDTDCSGMSVAEMGYRTKPFHNIMERAEDGFRKLLNVPDTHEVHFFNGGATLQFAAIPMNLLGGVNEGKSANYLMSGHWSEKARNEARLFGKVTEVAVDPKGLYFDIPEGKTWEMDRDGAYFHYTSADTRQGLEIRDFDFDAIPADMPVCCDASANLGSQPIDVSKYGVLYAASHKNFTTSGVCYTIIRKDLISDRTQLKATPTMCNWLTFQNAPNKIYNVPVLTAIWLGALNTEWMLERGGVEYFENFGNPPEQPPLRSHRQFRRLLPHLRGAWQQVPFTHAGSLHCQERIRWRHGVG